jgi:hypothetical protein
MNVRYDHAIQMQAAQMYLDLSSVRVSLDFQEMDFVVKVR